MPAPPHSTAGGEPVGAPGLMWGYGDAGGGRRQELRGTEKSAGGHRRRGLRTAGGGTVGAGGALLAAPPSVTVQPHGELPPLPIVLHLDGAALFQEAERRRVRHSRAGPRGCAVWERGAAGYREGTAGGTGPGRAVAAAPGAATGARPQEASCAPRARAAANGRAAVLF